MTPPFRIETLFAFIVVDEHGTEGIPARPMGDVRWPLVGADATRVDEIREWVKREPGLKGKKITLARFTTRTNIEVIDRTDA